MKADKKSTLRRLKIIRGQIDGIINMVEEGRYCIDISTQLMASIAGLKAVNNEVLKAHMKSCVKDYLDSEDHEIADEKIDKVIKILDKLSK